MCVEKYNLARYSSTGIPRNRSVPQNMQWLYVSFKGSTLFLGEMISCFSLLMRHFENY